MYPIMPCNIVATEAAPGCVLTTLHFYKFQQIRQFMSWQKGEDFKDTTQRVLKYAHDYSVITPAPISENDEYTKRLSSSVHQTL